MPGRGILIRNEWVKTGTSYISSVLHKVMIKNIAVQEMLSQLKQTTIYFREASLPKPCPASSVRARKEQAAGVWEP